MNLEIGTKLHGFTILEQQELPDLHGTGYIMEHTKSGAKLCYIQSEDDNKVFSVSFKTPPADHQGTPHILEHSVLCGSRKYDVKDPFNELAKGSLNTFLNAMTFSDKTMYPVASCNEDDLHNLMDVYLDAVFYPNIYKQKEIFLQEGWRYVYNEETESLDITGVVYNEMKGALSDPESKLSGVIAEKMFGDTVYGYESGGHPTYIPDLTYEAFLDFHRTYYHPSNSYLYLYGDMDLERCLAHIDGEYLSNFDAITNLPEIKEVDTMPVQEVQFDTFSVDDIENTETGYLTYTFNVGKSTDPALVMAIRILTYVLMETNASPVKKALIDAGICEEVEGWFDSSAYEMTFSIVGKNCEIDKIDDFKNTIVSVLEDMVTNGFDDELLVSSIRRLEFLLKEENYGSTPKGLIYGMNVMKNWLYGVNPLDRLHSLRILEIIKSPEYPWKNLISDLFLTNEKKSLLVFHGELDKGEKELAEEKLRLKDKRKSLTDVDLQQIADEKAMLDRFQTQEDTPENLCKIPILDISQVSATATRIPYEVSRVEECTEVFVPMNSNGIVYGKVHFDTNVLPVELLPYLGLLTELLGRLDTKKYGFAELPIAMNQLTGGFQVKHDIFSRSVTDYESFITFDFKFLKEDLSSAIELLSNIILETQFDEKENLGKLIKASKINGENSILNHLHTEAIHYSTSRLTYAGQINQAVSGIQYFQFLCETEKNFDETADEIIAKLKKTVEMLFTQSNVNVSIGTESDLHGAVVAEIQAMIAKLPKGDGKKQEYAFDLQPEKLAFTCDSAVQYNIVSANFKEYGHEFNGKIQVLRTILNQEYIWNKVRVQGGAYGGGCNFQYNGLAYFFSYRDPNITETYDVYKGLPEDLKGFVGSDRDLQKYILGTMNRLDQPKNNIDLLNESIAMVYQNLTYDMKDSIRAEILSTTSQDIQEFSDLIADIVATENICSIGNEQKLLTNAEYFTEVKKLNP
ncbi:insulinase family protein [Chakrabartyella piscis]|uniref:insulinase family protein n=1 Tax=Chakrabartyella piscis TaxID=2918914 RepID=UPI0029584183|nr:insulinase family protein [Chakrabartyella piscis]